MNLQSTDCQAVVWGNRKSFIAANYLSSVIGYPLHGTEVVVFGQTETQLAFLHTSTWYLLEQYGWIQAKYIILLDNCTPPVVSSTVWGYERYIVEGTDRHQTGGYNDQIGRVFFEEISELYDGLDDNATTITDFMHWGMLRIEQAIQSSQGGSFPSTLTWEHYQLVDVQKALNVTSAGRGIGLRDRVRDVLGDPRQFGEIFEGFASADRAHMTVVMLILGPAFREMWFGEIPLVPEAEQYIRDTIQATYRGD